MFGALVVQFAIGYLLDVDDGGRGRGRGRGQGSGRGRGRGGDDNVLDALGEDSLLTVHVAVGLTILALGALRLSWRRWKGLPPWSESLTSGERTFEHRIEQVLYGLMFAIPVSGMAVLLVSDDLLGVHVASHIAFFIAFAGHVGLVLKHQLLLRDGLLRRML
jgi:cytochrome b561